jgi:hypothetical protein
VLTWRLPLFFAHGWACVSQTLYTKDPDRGRPVMRNPSAAQINRLHQSEQLKAEELLAHGLSLDTSDAVGAVSKISTPDRHIAAGLLAACMPFPHAAKKERRESSAASKEAAASSLATGSVAPGASADAHSAAGSASAAAPVAAKPPNDPQVVPLCVGLCNKKHCNKPQVSPLCVSLWCVCVCVCVCCVCVVSEIVPYMSGGDAMVVGRINKKIVGL